MIIILFLGIGLHEYAHCKVADMAGDPTPSYYGRVTLNLTKHFEPIGTIMIVLSSLSGFGIGWGNPAPMDPRKMKNPRWDFFAAVIAGPLCNLAQAAVWGIILRVLERLPSPTPFLLDLALMGVFINLLLCFFNLIPLGPLDGHWLVGLLMPEKPRLYWFRFNRQVGMYLLLAIVLGPQLFGLRVNFVMFLFGYPIRNLFHIITGINAPL
jgi:Zn-dependent protease